MVHRVDGPIGVYRGFDGTDRRILSSTTRACGRDRVDALQHKSAELG